MVNMATSVSVVAIVMQKRRKLVGLGYFLTRFFIQRGNFYLAFVRCECADAYLVSEISQHSFMVC